MGQQVVAFGNAGGFLRRCAVVRDGGAAISGELEQMSANGVEAVMVGEAGVAVECAEQIESGSRPVDHGGGDGVVEHDHGIVRHALEEIVEREDLRPVGVFRAGGFVMNGGDGGLQCVTADRSFCERAGEQRGAFGDGALIP